jgi:hypothetical protein
VIDAVINGYMYPDTSFSAHPIPPQNDLPIDLMSSTGHTTPPSSLQLIIDALGDHARLTGIDLSKNPFAEKLQLSNSPESILELLEERESAFQESHDRCRTLINCLSPVVHVLHAFSQTLGEAITLVSYACPPVLLSVSVR